MTSVECENNQLLTLEHYKILDQMMSLTKWRFENNISYF